MQQNKSEDTWNQHKVLTQNKTKNNFKQMTRKLFPISRSLALSFGMGFYGISKRGGPVQFGTWIGSKQQKKTEHVNGYAIIEMNSNVMIYKCFQRMVARCTWLLPRAKILRRSLIFLHNSQPRCDLCDEFIWMCISRKWDAKCQTHSYTT